MNDPKFPSAKYDEWKTMSPEDIVVNIKSQEQIWAEQEYAEQENDELMGAI